MRSTSILRILESIDYVVDGKVIYPTIFLEWEEVEQVIDEYVNARIVLSKALPTPSILGEGNDRNSRHSQHVR